MTIRWSARAREDLEQLHAFLAPVDHDAALEVVELLLAAVRRLARTPRIGARLTGFEPREVRRLLVGDDEVRHELADRTVFILGLWHQRESR